MGDILAYVDTRLDGVELWKQSPWQASERARTPQVFVGWGVTWRELWAEGGQTPSCGSGRIKEK